MFFLFLAVIPLVGLLNLFSCLWDKPYQRCWPDNAVGTLTLARKAFAARVAAARLGGARRAACVPGGGS
ncbi:hypothetical protein [Streptomyces sp. 891-h]|uniref:hypothetical protein n=1 Tax=Streptomyces sp. 891-h TaxID=2720714 RepID=UPI001FAA6315|nr:hypothetical protein [Streptomyces sp. 891-h]UNZ21271.1 hypothetical protein HC362_33550 [Streptomyces sp. 891-h]